MQISPEIVFSEIFSTQKLRASCIGGKDYFIWKRKILFIFTNKGIDYVLHPTQPPDQSPTDQWTIDDATAQRLILRAIDPAFFYNLPTAKAMMEYLESVFNHSPPSIQQRINVFRRYMTCRMDKNATISMHLLELQGVVHELEMAGVDVPDEMQAVVLMNSLPESWNDVAYLLNLQLKENELGFDNISKRLRIAAEMRPRSCGNNPGYRGYCCLCRQLGHNLLNCPEDQGATQDCNSDNSVPFMEELNLFEDQYRRIKTSTILNNTGKNFSFWKSMLSRVLRGSDLIYVVEKPKPPEPTDSSPEQDAIIYNKWLADDFTCRHIILGALENKLFLAFQNQPTAKALMDKLNDWFDFPSLGRRMALLRQYVAWRMSDHIRIDDHIFNMEKMVMELKRAGIDVPDEIQAVVLIDSLPRSWEEVRLPMTFRIDKETKKGAKLLDSAIESVRNAGNIMALNENIRASSERMNQNDNYQGKSKKKRKKLN